MKRAAFLLSAFCLLTCAKHDPVVVGSKNFTESVILGELLAQKLESARCSVDRRLNMGGSLVCDAAIAAGSLDAYVEYSGTALTAILHQPATTDRAAVDRNVAAAYAKRGLRWGPNLGFNNTFAMIVRRDYARQHALHTISDLRKVQAEVRPGFGYEFVERPDGWPGLVARYHLDVANPPKTMDLGLTYKALAAGEIDLIAGNSTDGLIDSLGLVALADDLHYFPPYDAVPIVRQSTLARFPQLRAALADLAGRLSASDIRRLNYAVDGQHQDVAAVVRSFRRSKGL